MTIDDKRLTEIECLSGEFPHVAQLAAEIRRLWGEREDAIAALNSDTIRIAELSAQVRPPRVQVVELKKQLAHYDDLYGQERDRRIAAEAREKQLREALTNIIGWLPRPDAVREEWPRGEVGDLKRIARAALAAEEPPLAEQLTPEELDEKHHEEEAND